MFCIFAPCMVVLGYIVSIFIGVSLGLIGAGGSILSVPILVYLFGIPAGLAGSYSLLIVGVTTLFAAIRHYKMGNLHLKTAFYFAVPSIATLLIIRKYALPAIPEVLVQQGSFTLSKSMLLMTIFGLLMISASIPMIRKKKVADTAAPPRLERLVPIGLFVGVVTGLLGAGGGFIIVPALVLFAGLPMKQAVGTSLLIIFINSVVGFTGDIVNGVSVDLPLLFSITGIALLGMLAGTGLSKRINGAKLKPAFGWFVLVTGVYIIAMELLH